MTPARSQTRRVHGCLLAAALAGLLAAVQAAAAAGGCESLAGTRLRWIVPNSPGGGYDGYTRLLQPHLERSLGATIVVENRPEAGGIVAAAMIRDAAADGRTIGIVNASGLLAAGLDRAVPDPSRDFTLLARITTNRTVLLTGRDSGLASVGDLVRVAAKRPLVVGVRDAGSASVFAVPVIAELLGVDYALVTGYVGSNARVLAAIRGEVDLLVQNLDSTRRFIEDGELRALLLVTRPAAVGSPASEDPLMAAVPALGGPAGVAAGRARQLNRAEGEAMQKAEALASLIDAGRLVVAPPALPEATRRCLENALGAALGSAALRAAAERARLSLDAADAATARADVESAARALVQFEPLVRAALQRARQ